MPTFADRVYALCRKVPRGRVTTYKEIGDALGGEGMVYRAVGQALNRNPYAPRVPCHRVVASDGSLGGFASGLPKKIRILKREGIAVKDGRIVDFEKKRLALRPR